MTSDVRKDILYGYYKVRELDITVSRKDATVTRISDGIANKMLDLRFITEQQYNDYLKALSDCIYHFDRFDDYSIEELVSIFNHMSKEKGMIVPKELDCTVYELINKYKNAKNDFGNARGIRNIIEKIEKRKNSRCAKLLENNIEIDETIFRSVQKEDLEW